MKWQGGRHYKGARSSQRFQVVVEGSFNKVAVEEGIASTDKFAHMFLAEDAGGHGGSLFFEESLRDVGALSGGPIHAYLNVAASERFPMVLFSHEERQTGARRVDFAANPRQGVIIGKTYHSIYDAFVVFEGKRLPAPSKDRESDTLFDSEHLTYLVCTLHHRGHP